MTVIRPNSVSGINSITANGGDINLFRADGTKADIPIVNNITAGVVTATTFKGAIDATTGTFSGNLGVGGVLTYEDVTNIDSVGVITARSGINLTGGSLTIPDSIIHSGDTNTKIRFPEADAVTIETNGSERIRIQSDGDVGIGTINNTNNERLRVQDDASTSTVCQVSIISGSAERSILNFGDKEDPNIGRVSYHNNTNTISLFTNNTERLLINSDGHVTKPANPSFRATASSALDYTSDNTLAFQNEKHDVGGYYNNSNSYYTIPTTGYYKFEVMHFAQPGQVARVQLERSTDSGSSWSTIQIGPRIESSGGGRYIAGWMHVFHEFTATNLVRVRWSQGNVHINNGYGWFQGWLVQ